VRTASGLSGRTDLNLQNLKNNPLSGETVPSTEGKVKSFLSSYLHIPSADVESNLNASR
jgi:hypothetical protein